MHRLISETTTDLIAITTFGLKPTYTFVSPSHKPVMYNYRYPLHITDSQEYIRGACSK